MAGDEPIMEVRGDYKNGTYWRRFIFHGTLFDRKALLERAVGRAVEVYSVSNYEGERYV